MAEDFEKNLGKFLKEIEGLLSDARRAAEMINQLKKERAALLAEIDFLREENKNARALIAENERLSREKIWTQNRLEKILKKINSLNI
jgi:ABC-type Zn uptake system ZnuABC Zn-binding protein ZnuA